MTRKQIVRLLGLTAILGALIFTWACIQRPMKVPIPDTEVVEEFMMPQSAERDVDILFIIDDSGSMRNEQENLKSQFVSLMNALEQMKGGLPNVHIGVASTDLGTGSYTTIRYCEEFGGDQGILGKVKGVNRGETCIGAGQRYIVDVEPVGCNIDKGNDGSCSAHSCQQSHCDDTAGGNESLTLSEDANGCPRCRNYTGTLTDAFSCLAELGTNGCGFEQQLEAMYLALNETETPENSGFLRDSAFMATILITDEDDCSASRPDIIFNPDPNENRIDSTLGYLHSFRCFEFGITCDVNDRQVMGPRNNCEPREDDQALLYGISRYTAYIEAIKDPMMTVVAAIAGPVQDQVVVQMDAQNRPEIKPTCVDSTGEGADPGVRLKAFVEHFNGADAMGSWAYTSVCQSNFSDALEGIGNKIADIMAEKCPVQPFAGCREGPAGTSCSPCLPSCTIFDVENRNRPEQQRMIVHWCGHVCQNGLCTQADMQPCEYDGNGKCTCSGGLSPTLFNDEEYCAPLLYPEPPEQERDPQLLTLIPREEPACSGDDCVGVTSACWYMSANTTCEHNAGFRIVRGEDPPPRTFADGRCAIIPIHEQLCSDGKDNDEDCLVDEDDPDCSQQN
jgi:hypothetical protein